MSYHSTNKVDPNRLIWSITVHFIAERLAIRSDRIANSLDSGCVHHDWYTVSFWVFFGNDLFLKSARRKRWNWLLTIAFMYKYRQFKKIFSIKLVSPYLIFFIWLLAWNVYLQRKLPSTVFTYFCFGKEYYLLCIQSIKITKIDCIYSIAITSVENIRFCTFFHKS